MKKNAIFQLHFGGNIFMTSYSFEILGSYWLIAVCAVIGFFAAWLSYRRTIPPISQSRKTAVVLLRGTALTLIAFLLFEPAVSLLQIQEEPPRIAVLLDNSSSMALNDARVNRKEQYRALSEQLSTIVRPDEVDIFLFDGKTILAENYSTDSLTLKGNNTNISQAISAASAATERRNIRAYMLVSDGVFNQGEHPLYNAEQAGKPFFTIGIGDSTAPKDIAITSLLTNEVAYAESVLPVALTFSVSGFSGVDVAVRFRAEGNIIATETIRVPETGGIFTQTVNFQYKPTKPGVVKLSADIEPLQGEITSANNIMQTFVKVLDKKRTIALFAGAPSPDVAFISNFLQQDKDLTLVQYIQKKGSEYFEQPDPTVVASAEVLVLVGFPNSATPPAMIDMVTKEAERNKPLLFIASKDLDYQKLTPLVPFLPFTIAQIGVQEMLILPDISPKALSHPLLKLENTDADKDRWNSLPPIYKTETFVKARPEAEVLATMKLNTTALNEPLIIAGTALNRRTAAILGYGLHRWKLLGYAADIAKKRPEAFDVLDRFFDNTLRWLAAEQQGKRVRIKTTQQVYAVGEQVQFIGQVYDASYNPVDNATVRIIVQQNGGSERSVILTAIGNGRYAGNVEGLAPGDYSFSGTATDVNEVAVGNDAGRFLISDRSVESVNLQMNAPLMKLLADRTNGKFYAPESVTQAIEEIRSMPSFKPRPVEQKETFAFRNVIWFVSLIIALLATEWFLRKRGGLL